MSVTMALPDRRPSPSNPNPSAPGLSLNLGSNNPFRNRAVSPIPSPERSNVNTSSTNYMSKNPFLDPPAGGAAKPIQSADTSRLADDIFKDLSLLDRSNTNGAPSAPRNAPARSGTMNTSRPREDDDIRRHAARGLATSADKNILRSPNKGDPRRLRSNSESSVLDKDKLSEEDKRRRERRKEREARREKDGKSKDGKSSRTKKPQGLDVIDKLDVTGIYGQGLFHHDGPFDACNPHRNRKASNHRAPMQAFPANSANNSLGGAAPKSFDHDKFHGRGDEGFSDFAATRAEYTAAPRPPVYVNGKQQASFNPLDRVEQVHGEESYGLGTSTFLEGAPASRTAVQRRESEHEVPTLQGGNTGGLGRKKSLAMRIRGLSNQRRPMDGDGLGPTSPEYYTPGAVSAGGPVRAKPMQSETNPFFNEDSKDTYEKKTTQIRIAEPNTGRSREPGSPKPIGLTRSVTADGPSLSSQGESAEGKSGGGLLNRMKSLKGGRRARPERRAS